MHLGLLYYKKDKSNEKLSESEISLNYREIKLWNRVHKARSSVPYNISYNTEPRNLSIESVSNFSKIQTTKIQRIHKKEIQYIKRYL